MQRELTVPEQGEIGISEKDTSTNFGKEPIGSARTQNRL